MSMDVQFLSAVRSLPTRTDEDLEKALAKLLVQSSKEAPLTIKGVRDRFTTVNRAAKSGQIQVVKGTPGEETVIVSIKGLAAIIRAAAASLTFTDALAATGFQPIGPGLVYGEGFTPDDTLVLDSREEPEQHEDEKVEKRAVKKAAAV